MIYFVLALFLGFMAFYGFAMSHITRKTLAVWLDRFREAKGDMAEFTIQHIGDTIFPSYFVYKKNKLYYRLFVYATFLVNMFLTANLSVYQPLWAIVIVVGTNVLLVKWVVAMHKDRDLQIGRIKKIIGQYPQSFIKYDDI